MKRLCFPLLLTLLVSCASAQPVLQGLPLRLQFTFSTQPWLAAIETCADDQPIDAELRSADLIDLSTTDLAIRLGEAGLPLLPAYQVGAEDILVIVNLQNPVDELSRAEVLGLFTGTVSNWQEINGRSASVQVWSFDNGEDVSAVFVQSALGGSPITSQARLATSPQEMVQAIASDVDAVGILTRGFLTDELVAVYSLENIPVLVYLPTDNQDSSEAIIACLQK